MVQSVSYSIASILSSSFLLSSQLTFHLPRCMHPLALFRWWLQVWAWGRVDACSSSCHTTCLLNAWRVNNISSKLMGRKLWTGQPEKQGLQLNSPPSSGPKRGPPRDQPTTSITEAPIGCSLLTMTSISPSRWFPGPSNSKRPGLLRTAAHLPCSPSAVFNRRTSLWVFSSHCPETWKCKLWLFFWISS